MHDNRVFVKASDFGGKEILLCTELVVTSRVGHWGRAMSRFILVSMQRKTTTYNVVSQSINIQSVA